ncbi:MAG: hypothetical protein ACXV8O_14680 [Methylobacter sp.]
MKYLFIALLLSISPAAMADLQYMSQQMKEMKYAHELRMLQEQQSQQERTKSYLQQRQEQEQNRISQSHRRQYRRISLINRLE